MPVTSATQTKEQPDTMKRSLFAAAAMLLTATTVNAQSTGIWASIPIPKFAKHTKPPELPIFDYRLANVTIYPAPLIIWPDPELVRIPMRTQMVCSSGAVSRCYTISPWLR
jgi:hypothetical protein